MAVLAQNRKAYFNYELLEKFEAGLVLEGQEVKSAKLGKMNIQGSFILPKKEEFYLVGATIPPYQPKNIPFNYNPQRDRKILIKKDQIKYLIGKTKLRGLTLIPLKVYTKKGLVKLEFALAKIKKKFDKREQIKKREVEEEIKRAFKWG